MDNKVSEFRTFIDGSDNIVFFGGAGVSTESGIPDFRSTSGLYNQKYAYPPETIISHSFFVENAEEFYRFYKDKMIYLNARPNAAHLKLAELESEGKVKAIVTQNIDNLHQMAGSKCVYELHGSVFRNYCTKCGKFHSAEYIMRSIGVPRCDCGGILKPDVVLYEESLDPHVLKDSIKAIENADVLIVGGTSLVVYPAAGLLQYYKGDKLVLINKTELPQESRAALVIHGNIGEVMSQI